MGFLFSFLSAILLTAANYKPELYFLNWFGFLAFFYYIYIFKKGNLSFKMLIFSSWNLSFWILVFNVNFLYYPLKEYLGISFLAIILILALLFSLLALIYLFFLILYFYLQRNIFAKEKLMPLLFAVIWTLMEIMRHYLFNFFPVANLSYTQVEFLSFIQLAEIGGIWILTFFLVYFNALFFNFIFYRKKKNGLMIIILFLTIFTFNYFNFGAEFQALNQDHKKEKINIGIITTRIDQSSKWSLSQLNKNIELTLKAASNLKKADLIIAPETNLTFDFYSEKKYREGFLTRVADNFNQPLQIGSLASTEKKNKKGAL